MKAALAATLLLALGACGKPRTAAATQPTPAAFDPAGSDPKALEVVDAGLAALGGGAAASAWDAVKELRFSVKYTLDGTLKGWFKHAWDRWNGRHAFFLADLTTDTGKPGELKWREVRYDLFDAERLPYATYGGREITREDAAQLAKAGRERLSEEGYLLTMIYKLRDPGVHVADAGEVKDLAGTCLPSCRTVKVTFDPGVGKDTWYVNYNSETKLPEAIETERKGGRLGYRLSDWTTAGGLKFPTKLTNLGLAGEIYLFEEITAGAPEDMTYLRPIT
jgi:hypothetical protein